MQTTQKLIAISFLLMLSACGGSGSIPSKAVAPLAVPKPPVLAPGVTPGNLQVNVTSPPATVSADVLGAFNALNDFRASVGLGKLNYSPELSVAATNHRIYQFNNYLSPTYSFHFEDPLGVGFTGVAPIDRARFAGYATTYNYVTEDGSTGANGNAALLGLIDTVYHRSSIAGQDYRDVGIDYLYQPKVFRNGTILPFGSLLIDIGYKTTPQRNASDFYWTYPLNDQTNVNLSMCSESPAPFPEIDPNKSCDLIGYPVSFIAEKSQTLVVTKFTIKIANTASNLDAWLLTQKTDPNKYLPANEAYLTPKGAMQPNTTYQVSFEGTINGKAVSKDWKFTTAAQQIFY
ncbi:MAG: CAP domain-containing protein [Burkholderiaceae bacterium]|nr:CAP domain-containing protein [Burkholderiaceae bacterium]